MKYLLNAISAAAVLASGSAMAADLTHIAPPPAFTWTGFYLGANIGGGWGKTTGSTFVTATGAFAAALDRSASGVVGGGQVGYNYELPNKFVLGVEADIDGSGAKGSENFRQVTGGVANLAAVSTGDTNLFGTVRARVGFDLGAFLPFVTGGLAWRDAKSSRTQYATPLSAAAAPAFSTVPVFTESDNETNAGWTLGGGVEWKFMQNWTARVEYLYMNFGRQVTSDPGALASIYSYVAPGVSNGRTSYATTTDQVVRVGVNYMFN